MPKQDPHSYALPEVAKVSHLDLDIEVDFDASQLRGTAVLGIETQPGAREIVLDAKGLTVDKVLISPNRLDTKEVNPLWGASDPHMGQSLTIPIEENTTYVHITYSTNPEAEALQFLPASLTADKRHPFLLTQSQAILARTWVPIQDSPGIRFTYDARVKVPKNLLAIMSATNPTEKSEDGVYLFKMEQPIPAYLLALAVGDLTFAPLGERSGVYAEPSVLKAATYEFGEVEEMINIAEQLYGPYKWERYDIVVLPPSFPFGGMENPRLTFATPTILAGDRSLVSLVAHELAHSWSGNLVTNATWNDFWLNEGFTVYFENRIMEALKGRDYSEMLAYISYQDLTSEISDMGQESPDTRLSIELSGRNPDDGMTSIAYDKGYYFLRLIEETVGREAFDAFLKEYFNEHAFQSMDTESFLTELDEKLLNKHPGAKEEVGVDNWVKQTGIPDNIPIARSKRFQQVSDALTSWIAGMPADQLEVSEWSTHEWLHFIRTLPDSISEEQLARLDASFGFTKRTNSELQFAWYLQAVESQYKAAYPAMRRFLIQVGRRKFLSPLYRAMMQTGQEELARDIYAQARENYHPIARGSIDEIVNLNTN
ncbi:MAG: M1 family metallopeptidase [Bacteroidota bacterium]